MKVKVTYSQLWWSILGIHALHLPIQVHTQQWTHTHREHTPRAVGSHICCSAWGRVGGTGPCSRAPRHGIEGEESTVHSLASPTIPAGPRHWLATFRLRVRLSTIRPRLPLIKLIVRQWRSNRWLRKKLQDLFSKGHCEKEVDYIK